jgi:hypothetical protein
MDVHRAKLLEAAPTRAKRSRTRLSSEDFLHLADFLLDLPTYLFDLAFGF